MRSKIYSILTVVLVVAILSCVTTGAGTSPQNQNDLRNFLFQPPNSFYNTYGYSEENLLLFNIISGREERQKLEVRIKTLEDMVKALEVQVANNTTVNYLEAKVQSAQKMEEIMGEIKTKLFPDPNNITEE